MRLTSFSEAQHSIEEFAGSIALSKTSGMDGIRTSRCDRERRQVRAIRGRALLFDTDVSIAEPNRGQGFLKYFIEELRNQARGRPSEPPPPPKK
jgi:hypothetical protein